MPVTRVRVGLGAVGTAEQGRWPVPGETITKVRLNVFEGGATRTS